MSMATYDPIAPWYDVVYAGKDYAGEARKLDALLRQHVRSPGRSLLDVACGTGMHVAHLARGWHCTGLDASGAMLRVARRRVPGARFVQGDMRSFDLGERFDAVLCLFSAIGYARTLPGLRRTLCTFARHLAPGGVCIVEPWLRPAAVRARKPGLIAVEAPGFALARVSGTRVRGRISMLDMQHLVAVAGRPVQHIAVRHELAMFSVAEMRAAFRAAGLRPVFLPEGLQAGRIGRDRGLWLATKPLSAPAPAPPRAPGRARAARRA